MSDEELIARATAGEGGAWTWEALAKELSRCLEAANTDAAALFADMCYVEWDDEDPSAETKSMADHRARLELS